VSCVQPVSCIMVLLFRCLLSVRTKLVFSQFYIYLTHSSVRPGLWYCTLWRHVLSWTERWHKNYVSLFCRSPRFKKQKVSEPPVTNTKKLTAS